VITYYLSHQSRMHSYVTGCLEEGKRDWQEQELGADEFVRELRERLEQRRKELRAVGKLPGPRPAA